MTLAVNGQTLSDARPFSVEATPTFGEAFSQLNESLAQVFTQDAHSAFRERSEFFRDYRERFERKLDEILRWPTPALFKELQLSALRERYNFKDEQVTSAPPCVRIRYDQESITIKSAGPENGELTQKFLGDLHALSTAVNEVIQGALVRVRAETAMLPRIEDPTRSSRSTYIIDPAESRPRVNNAFLSSVRELTILTAHPPEPSAEQVEEAFRQLQRDEGASGPEAINEIYRYLALQGPAVVYRHALNRLAQYPTPENQAFLSALSSGGSQLLYLLPTELRDMARNSLDEMIERSGEESRQELQLWGAKKEARAQLNSSSGVDSNLSRSFVTTVIDPSDGSRLDLDDLLHKIARDQAPDLIEHLNANSYATFFRLMEVLTLAEQKNPQDVQAVYRYLARRGDPSVARVALEHLAQTEPAASSFF